MDFINRNINTLIKMIVPIGMIILAFVLLTTVLPFILLLIAVVFGVNFLMKKFSKIRNNVKYNNNKIDIEEVKNEEKVFNGEIIDVEYREVEK
ncbi:hypothetical protein K144316041_06570 [Clostridium tetani]|uniref:Uncharacterized protein n=1 Tax=Clostridium tetani TaxID=1513 RepID=A0A4Q0UYB8_CLOTA|nr:hypothetical protein [Clostridium tetani]KHO39807.1 hypothetical protein OR62_04265 [Clostridium tetani]RXI38471.1 hypothetical protein DP129_09545 [Clostridium tetani]RXI50443.1 hypothetical protein DP130_00275 [Clostridium tetani]RXI54229.1 hypothetical protein DP131_10385 [Clostridium tetani]RXI68891.1 hypothetical protein DQN76_08745 [Clostridium tetani]